jgi:tRNA pseudouridine38-40 synthase
VKCRKKETERADSREPLSRNIKIILEYDGTRYCGFQKQPGKQTIQQEIEKALKRLLSKPVKISAASGRTDAGVHASFQVVNFKTAKPLALNRIQMGLNYYLPPDIAVVSAQDAPPDFHARYSAKKKIYEYRIWNHRVRSPLRASQYYHVPFALDLKVMQAAAKTLIGKHDFSSFCSTGSARRDPVRRVTKLAIRKRGDEIIMRIEANGFLYHMVRNIAGTLIEAGRGKATAEDVKAILTSCGRRKSLHNAPGHALALAHVTY